MLDKAKGLCYNTIRKKEKEIKKMYIVTAYKIWEEFEDYDEAELYFAALRHGGYKYVELKKKTTTDKYEYFESIKIFVK